jgi:hypothetical protein
MLALPMMMIRQPETASRRQLRAGALSDGGINYRGYNGASGTGTLDRTELLGATGVGTILALVQNTANNNTYLQIQHGGLWFSTAVYGLINVTRGIELPEPTFSRVLSPTAREWGWESGAKDLGLVVGATHTILVRAIGVGW